MCVSVCVRASAPLYALVQDLSSRQTNFVSIDPQSYRPTPIGKSIPYGLSIQEGSGSIDVANGIYYFTGAYPGPMERMSSFLVGISLKDGSVGANISLPFAGYSDIALVDHCIVDVTTGDVFVTGRVVINGPTRISRVSVKARTVTTIADISEIVLSTYGTHDPTDNTIYLRALLNNGTNGYYRLYGIDGKSGKILSRTDADVLTTADYDPVTKMLYGLYFNETRPAGDRYSFRSYNQKGGKATDLAVLNKVFTRTNVAALDSRARTFTCFLSHTDYKYNMVTLDISTGKISYDVPACDKYYTAACPYSIQYGGEK